MNKRFRYHSPSLGALLLVTVFLFTVYYIMIAVLGGGDVAKATNVLTSEKVEVDVGSKEELDECFIKEYEIPSFVFDDGEAIYTEELEALYICNDIGELVIRPQQSYDYDIMDFFDAKEDRRDTEQSKELTELLGDGYSTVVVRNFTTEDGRELLVISYNYKEASIGITVSSENSLENIRDMIKDTRLVGGEKKAS